MNIARGDIVSWKRIYEDSRMFGRVVSVTRGVYIVKDSNGLRYAIRARDITKEAA